jgi:tRNA pseudouridine38-40 synthase
LVLEYDGREFEGWQIQAGERASRTVQGVLLEAAHSITGDEPRVRGAGRTDAGVHAEGQVASLQVTTALSSEAFMRALNARLPADLAVRQIAEVAKGWDALREARRKHYRYQVWNGRERSPLRAARWVWIRESLSVEAMREAGQAFLGRHDFSSMQGAGSSVRTTVRTIQALRVAGQAGDEIVFDVEGEGFLRHMVRNLVGTLLEIGRGRWEPAHAATILASLDRGRAGPTAPAHGLILVSVHDSWSDDPVSNAGSEPLSVDERGPVG